jgi:mannose-6-phosphate isomerase-like protein (cupin superfamily)
MPCTPINLQDKLSLLTKHWSPKIIAQLNDYHLKVVKVQGEFVWHDHPETDEVFLVIEGTLEIHFRDDKVMLNAGELYVVPRGVEHKPYAAEECHILLIEPAGTVNTGNADEGQASEAGIGATEGDWV